MKKLIDAILNDSFNSTLYKLYTLIRDGQLESARHLYFMDRPAVYQYAEIIDEIL